MIVTKKGGYDLSFLDQLGDLENASPTSLLGRPAQRHDARDASDDADDARTFHLNFPTEFCSISNVFVAGRRSSEDPRDSRGGSSKDRRRILLRFFMDPSTIRIDPFRDS